jgi:hypothetical protein
VAGESQLEVAIGAIMERLSGDAALSDAAIGGIHLTRAPDGTERPYVVVAIRPGGTIEQTLGQARAMRGVNVEVVGYTNGAGSLAGVRIDERIDQLLADYRPVVAAPWSVAGCRRIVDVNRDAVDDGVEIDGRGGLYRVKLSGGPS